MPSMLERFFHKRSSQWLLHGSPKKIKNALEPRQPAYLSGYPEYSVRGLYATDHVVLAVLYAVLAAPKTHWGWRVRAGKVQVIVDGLLVVRPGYLYVVAKKPFRLADSNLVWRTTHSVVPVGRETVPASLLFGLEEAGVVKICKKGAA